MLACRAAWRRCGALTRRSLTPRTSLRGDVVPRRLMSSVPGGSGENLLYAVLCGGAFVGAMTYAYKTVSDDHAHYNARITEIEARPKTAWKPKPWPPKSEDDDEAVEVAEAVPEANGEEAGLVELAADVNGEEAGSAETVVERVAEAVAETAEVVAEAAAVVEVAAEEVAAVAKEVEEMAEKVEAAAEALEAPVVSTAEDPASAGSEEPETQNNVTPDDVELAAASVLEHPLLVPLDEVTSTSDEASLAPPTQEGTLLPGVDELPVTPSTEDIPLNPTGDEAPVTPVTEEVPVDPTVDEIPVILVTEETIVAPAVEEATVSLVAEESPVGQAPEEAVVAPAEDAPVPPEVEDVPVPQEEPLIASVAEEVLVALAPEEAVVAPAAEQAPFTPVVEAVPVPPATEEAVAAVVPEDASIAPAAEETPAALVTEESPVVVSDSEEAPSTQSTEEVSTAPVPLEAEAVGDVAIPSITEVAHVVVVEDDSVPGGEDAPKVAEQGTGSSEVVAESPIVAAPEVPSEESPVVEVAVSKTEGAVEGQVAPVETEEPCCETCDEAPESKREYIVVVLEGAPKSGKKPKVLGVAPVTGRIIPAPDNEEEPAGQVTGQAPPA